MFRASVLLSEARRFAPEVVVACEAAFAGHEMDADFWRIINPPITYATFGMDAAYSIA